VCCEKERKVCKSNLLVPVSIFTFIKPRARVMYAYMHGGNDNKCLSGPNYTYGGRGGGY